MRTNDGAGGTAFVSAFPLTPIDRENLRTIAQYHAEFTNAEGEPLRDSRVARAMFDCLKLGKRLPEASSFDGGSIVYVKNGVPDMRDGDVYVFEAAVRIGGKKFEGRVSLQQTSTLSCDGDQFVPVWKGILREMARAGKLFPQGRRGLFPEDMPADHVIEFRDQSGRTKKAYLVTGFAATPGIFHAEGGEVLTGYAADVTSQVVRKETVLEMLRELLADHGAPGESLLQAYGRADFRRRVQSLLEGKSILTEHELGAPQRRAIRRLDFSRRLESTFPMDAEGGGTREISHAEYFRTKHPNIELEGDDDAPILVYEQRPREEGAPPRPCYLPPSLARLTGIYDGETELRQKVLKLSKMNSQARAQKCVAFNQQIVDAGQHLIEPEAGPGTARKAPADAWDLQPSRSLMRAQHTLLQPPRILSGGDLPNRIDPVNGTFPTAATNPVYSAPRIRDCLIVYPPDRASAASRPAGARGIGEEHADRLMEWLRKVAAEGRAPIDEMRPVPAAQPSLEHLRRSGVLTAASYLASVRENIRPTTDIIFFILPRKGGASDLYEELKGGTIGTYAACTQCVRAESLSNLGKIKQAVLGILRQVVSKCGGEVWRVDGSGTIAPRGCGDLFVGLATRRSTRERGHVVVAAVCWDTSRHLATNARSVREEPSDAERRAEAACAAELVAGVLREAAGRAGAAPEAVRALVFRGGASNATHGRLARVEAPAMRAAVGRALPGARVGYAAASKAKQRAYFVGEGASAADLRSVQNPPAGLCITGPGTPAEYPTVLVTHSSLPNDSGTPLLSQYTILHDETGLSREEWAQCTQNLCCAYPNQPKAISEPAPLRMAQRTANQHAGCMKGDAIPHEQLREVPYAL